MLISHKGSDESILKIFSKIPNDLTEMIRNKADEFGIDINEIKKRLH